MSRHKSLDIDIEVLQDMASWLRDHGVPNVTAKKTGKAGALRIVVPKLNVKEPFELTNKQDLKNVLLRFMNCLILRIWQLLHTAFAQSNPVNTYIHLYIGCLLFLLVISHLCVIAISMLL